MSASMQTGRPPCRRRPPPSIGLVPAVVAGLAMSFLAVGCQQHVPAESQVPPADPAAAAAPASSSGRGSVELLTATAKPVQVDEDMRIVDFKVTYRFTSGAPVKYYLCEIAFPGTECWGVKPFIPNELQSEGVFTTKIEVGDAPVKEFRMTLSEADSPDRGFHLISNELTGVIESSDSETQPPTDVPADTP